MSNSTPEDVRQEEPEPISIAEFLESIAPNQSKYIADLCELVLGGSPSYRMKTPDLQLYCTQETCNGLRFFKCISRRPDVREQDYSFFYLTYRCANCGKHERTYSIAARKNEEDDGGIGYKFGELPTYGPPVSPKLIKLIGPDRDIFLKGRSCENHGLGIGAFVYYRRVVENQKNRVLEEIKKVAQKISAPKKVIQALDAAIDESQFSKALDLAEEGIPESLMIDGHNPMKLLHSALSDGLHARTDEECMGIATSVRVVLGELSDRLSQALKDEAELKNAVAMLTKSKT